MKAPNTMAQPQPPSGGVYPTGPPTAGAMDPGAYKALSVQKQGKWSGEKREKGQHRNISKAPYKTCIFE